MRTHFLSIILAVVVNPCVGGQSSKGKTKEAAGSGGSTVPVISHVAPVSVSATVIASEATRIATEVNNILQKNLKDIIPTRIDGSSVWGPFLVTSAEVSNLVSKMTAPVGTQVRAKYATGQMSLAALIAMNLVVKHQATQPALHEIAILRILDVPRSTQLDMADLERWFNMLLESKREVVPVVAPVMLLIEVILAIWATDPALVAVVRARLNDLYLQCKQAKGDQVNWAIKTMDPIMARLTAADWSDRSSLMQAIAN